MLNSERVPHTRMELFKSSATTRMAPSIAVAAAWFVAAGVLVRFRLLRPPDPAPPEVNAEAKPVLELPSPPLLVLPNVFPPPACPNELPVVEPKLGAMPLFAAVVAPPPVPPNKPPNTPAK